MDVAARGETVTDSHLARYGSSLEDYVGGKLSLIHISEVEIGNIRRGGRHKKSGGQRGQRRAAENGLPADKVQNAGGREMHRCV